VNREPVLEDALIFLGHQTSLKQLLRDRSLAKLIFCNVHIKLYGVCVEIYWNRESLSLSSSVPLKVLEMWALVPLEFLAAPSVHY